jgi:uncharacterized protein YciI
MLHAVLFEDDASRGAELRRRHMQAHFVFLERNAARITAAGPLLTLSGEPAGGLWLVEAEEAAAIDALIKEDPFWKARLRHSVRILRWSQVFAAGKRSR